MFWQKQQKDWRSNGAIALAIGAGLGVAAAAFFGIRARRRRQYEDDDIDGELLELETRVVEALAADEVAGSMPIEVEAIADGILELTGRVESEQAARRAVEVASSIDGVRTVLNRMDIRRAVRANAGQGSGGSWEGVGVGMGSRRQSRETEPDRPSDRIDMVTREYESERRSLGETQAPVSGAGDGAETPPM